VQKELETAPELALCQRSELTVDVPRAQEHSLRVKVLQNSAFGVCPPPVRLLLVLSSRAQC
jgi:hypothetical protein